MGEGFEPIAGLSADEADPVGCDGTRLPQTWRGNASAICALAGQRIRLRFFMENYDLFSYRAA